MITLKKVTVHKYKCVETDQVFDVEPDTTVLVGMNESGKTSLLEVLAKSNYFQDDPKYKYSTTHDYPRREKKKMDKSGVVPKAVTCVYQLDGALVAAINNDLGEGTFDVTEISLSSKYDNRNQYGGLKVRAEPLYGRLVEATGLDSTNLLEQIRRTKKADDFAELLEQEQFAECRSSLETFQKYFENKWEWDDPIGEYVARVWLRPHLPKFLYYDEYYSLPPRISIEELQSGTLEQDAMKTAKALVELADIDLRELVGADDFEDYKAELEATQAAISDELFKYWSTNANLEINFDIEKKERTDDGTNTRIVEHILDIRVKNKRTGVSLSLKNRSKGFNWFFSFLVWFTKIQEDRGSQYIVLLDEPGLNLHAAAQSDLLDFLADLSEEYQVIYTTHSPFMVRPSALHKVRTVLETKKGSTVSESIQQKDPNTLFPLQAALGYDIAQNLFISDNNLLVEGTSDLIFLEAMSGVLQAAGRTGLRDDITIVPVGGLDRVSTFISLLRGSKLNVACLLDSVTNQKQQSSLDRLIADKIIRQQKIAFYDRFVAGASEGDVEDLFAVEDYLRLFNGAFTEHKEITASDLGSDNERLVARVAAVLGKPRYNHYRPARFFARQGLSATDLNETSLDQFEAAIQAANSLF